MTPIPGQWERRDGPKVLATPDRISEGVEGKSDAATPTDANGSSARTDHPSAVAQEEREPRTWLNVSFGVVVLLAVMFLVMWVQQRPPLCAAAPEAPRRLQLDRVVDQEHLAADRASATRTAHRFSASDAGTTEGQERFEQCETLLVREIATTHSVSVNDVRASAGSSVP